MLAMCLHVTEVTKDGEHVVVYDDAYIETVNMAEEVWRYEPAQSMNANTVLLEITLYSNEQLVLKELMATFGYKPFMWHHVQEF